MPKVSFIIGAYNCEDTLDEALQSVLNQTFTDWQAVICDDASTDGTLEKLKAYEKQYPGKFVILHNEKNLTLAGSLNHCLEAATGEYIARMDCDDISVPARLEKQVAFLDAHPEYAVVGTYMQSFDENGMHHIIPNKQEPTKYDLPKSNAFHHATILMRKSVYDDLNGYTVSQKTRRLEDAELWYRFFHKGYKGYTLAEPLYLVREDRATFKRRKLKYCVDASKVIMEGINLLELPKKNYIYALKPIVSYFTPQAVKRKFRNNFSNNEQ
ncbi:MAG: glycosyltransferase family 2 protein [Clostridia bacterium]|nr:glycosyltransferase family 2 protein [Clostridia bacterium]